MKAVDPIIFVVDDDASVRKALKRLLTTAGLTVETFASAQEFLDRPRYDGPRCLVLDVRLPGLGGLDLQSQLTATNLRLPIIFITGHGDVPMSVRAMKAGAVDFLTKPFNDQDLLDAIQLAIERDRQIKQQRADVAEIHERVGTLTPREREVFALVVTGMLNKQIAAELGTSEKTIKVHRARVMKKMQAGSLADLVRLAERVGVTSLLTSDE
jgi:RNA polymerase sigma factor (sigma-70 family)